MSEFKIDWPTTTTTGLNSAIATAMTKERRNGVNFLESVLYVGNDDVEEMANYFRDNKVLCSVVSPKATKHENDLAMDDFHRYATLNRPEKSAIVCNDPLDMLKQQGVEFLFDLADSCGRIDIVTKRYDKDLTKVMESIAKHFRYKKYGRYHAGVVWKPEPPIPYRPRPELKWLFRYSPDASE